MGTRMVDVYAIEKRVATEFPKRLFYARTMNKLLQCQIEKDLGLAEGAVCRWETGRGLPQARLLAALAEELGVTTDWLLGLSYEGGAIDEDEMRRLRL